MTRNTAAIFGVGVGIVITVLVVPLAVGLGGLSAAFQRGHAPTTFGHGIAWAFRGAFYVFAAAVGVGILAIAFRINAHAMLGLLFALAVVSAAITVHDPGDYGGGVL